jgi:hypothetical protein
VFPVRLPRSQSSNSNALKKSVALGQHSGKFETAANKR